MPVVGHLGGEGRMEGAGCLFVMGQLRLHGPHGDGGDDPALRQGAQVPALVEVGEVAVAHPPTLVVSKNAFPTPHAAARSQVRQTENR